MTTTPDSAAQGGVTVAQVDRDFAAQRLERQAADWPDHPSRHTAAMIRDGKFDGHDWVQDYAAHRLASSPPAQQAGVEDALREVERMTALCKANNDLARMNGQHRDEWRVKAVVLMEALEPFARCADELDGSPEDGVPRAPDGEWAKFRLLTDDYRRARAALRPSTDAAAQPTDAEREKRLGWHVPENLRWLAEQSSRPDYMPCGVLTGMFLKGAADMMEDFARKVAATPDGTGRGKADG